MKRKIFAGAVVAIFLSLMAYGTIAYFTAEEVTHNVITSGEIDIELLEWADEEKTVPFPADGVHGVMPGTEVTKIVEVKNTGTNAAYIRVKVEKTIILQEIIDARPDSNLVNLDFDSTYWTLGEDGFYYYKEALEAGKVTKPLFTTVSMDKQMDNIYQNSTAKVDVKAYAVQVANNGSNALEANGWPEE